jgi:hypothetical protein
MVGTSPKRADCHFLQMSFPAKEDSMARYYFPIQHNSVEYPDVEGSDLPDDKTAWNHATKACGEIIRDMDGKMQPNTQWAMEVRGEAQLPIFTIAVTTKSHR